MSQGMGVEEQEGVQGDLTDVKDKKVYLMLIIALPLLYVVYTFF